MSVQYMQGTSFSDSATEVSVQYNANQVQGVNTGELASVYPTSLAAQTRGTAVFEKPLASIMEQGFVTLRNGGRAYIENGVAVAGMAQSTLEAARQILWRLRTAPVSLITVANGAPVLKHRDGIYSPFGSFAGEPVDWWVDEFDSQELAQKLLGKQGARELTVEEIEDLVIPTQKDTGLSLQIDYRRSDKVLATQAGFQPFGVQSRSSGLTQAEISLGVAMPESMPRNGADVKPDSLTAGISLLNLLSQQVAQSVLEFQPGVRRVVSPLTAARAAMMDCVNSVIQLGNTSN